MEQQNPIPSTSSQARQKVENPFDRERNSDSDDLESSDEYSTDDSNTFGLNLQDQYPIKSVTLHTDNHYNRDNPGVVNSGPIDQWITAILLQFCRRKVYNFELFRHTAGSGKALEDVIKQIAIKAGWRSSWSPPSVDNRLKKIWTDFAKVAVPIDEGMRIKVLGGENFNVTHHLEPVTRFTETVTCSCIPARFRRKTLHHLKIRNLRDIEKTISGKNPTVSFGGLRHCKKCCQPFKAGPISFPPETWILVQEVDNQATIKYNDFQRKLRFGEVDWSLAYLTFSGPGYHEHDPMLFSIHIVGNRAFYYNGARDHGTVKTFSEPRLVRFATLERAIYFRDAI